MFSLWPAGTLEAGLLKKRGLKKSSSRSSYCCEWRNKVSDAYTAVIPQTSSNITRVTRLLIRGQLDQIEVNMLVDSGAEWSIIREDTLRKVAPSAIRTLIPESAERAASAMGQPLQLIGKRVLSVKLGKMIIHQLFRVTRDLTVECLLRADFLQQNKCVLDCGENTLAIKGCRVARWGKTMPETTAGCAKIASDTSRPTPTGHLAVKGEAHIDEMIRCVDVELTLAEKRKLRTMHYKARKVFGRAVSCPKA
ncbi:hypothetical protein M513_09266 [Trichuris suis]|uniref:Aspartic peptidase DDI1-type domain-containing protein n=1 Tax=Trichuris suis TaxID=68888 RepID=A0A085LXV3_9BILA|nr:hypothetical protein M513_09266 [Trichuris suis]